MPHKKKKKEQVRKRELGRRLFYSHLRVRDKKALCLSTLTPFFHPFLDPAVNSDESIRIIINGMTLLLFIWTFFPFADSIFAFYLDGGKAGSGICLCSRSSNPFAFLLRG